VVWARGGVAVQECPVSFITARSTAWVEAFFARKAFGGPGVTKLGAREAEAFLLLEDLLARERNDG
jgi:hypothetical protein